jgi:hypothetical protein
LEFGGNAAGYALQDSKGITDVIEEYITSAKNKEQEGIIKNTCTNSELSQETDDGDVHRLVRIKGASKVEGVKCSSGIAVEEGGRSGAESTDDTEGHRSEN